MANKLERRLAAFLVKTRGERTYAEFPEVMELPVSTLHRLEKCKRSTTLTLLEKLMRRLNCRLKDILGDA